MIVRFKVVPKPEADIFWQQEPPKRKDDIDLDEIERRAEDFSKRVGEYLDEQGADYRIDYGILDQAMVSSEWEDGRSEVLLFPRFEVITRTCFPGDPPEDMPDRIDEMLEASGLGEFLFYDGWESGSCASDDPGEWPKNYWYEHRGDGFKTSKTIESHDFGPRYETGLKKLKAKLLR